MAVGRKNEGHLQPSTGGVLLGLLQPVARRVLLGLGLDQSHSHGLIARGHRQTQRVVNPTPGLSARLAGDDVYCPGGLFPTDEILGPPALMKGRVN